MKSKTLNALELFEKDLIKLIDKADKKLMKEKEIFNKKVQELEEYDFKEYNINEAWGCDGISRRKRDSLINLLNNYNEFKEEKTVLGHYKNILLNDLKQIRINIQIEKGEDFD